MSDIKLIPVANDFLLHYNGGDASPYIKGHQIIRQSLVGFRIWPPTEKDNIQLGIYTSIQEEAPKRFFPTTCTFTPKDNYNILYIKTIEAIEQDLKENRPDLLGTFYNSCHCKPGFTVTQLTTKTKKDIPYLGNNNKLKPKRKQRNIIWKKSGVKGNQSILLMHSIDDILIDEIEEKFLWEVAGKMGMNECQVTHSNRGNMKMCKLRFDRINNSSFNNTQRV